MRRSRPLLAVRRVCLTGVLASLLLVTPPARAERAQDGNLLASFDASLRPASLPRERLAPVAVRVAGDFWDAAGETDRLPQLRRIHVGINRRGRLFDRGLPVCHVEEIQPARESAAREICGAALVGSGHVRLQVRIPGQLPFLVRAPLLAFNGPRRRDDKLIFAQAYARNPPGSFVLTFHVRRRPGLFGTVLSTTLPPAAGDWAYLTHFDMTLHRTYEYRGRTRSYVSAACAAPAGFDSALFPFARVGYGFDSGQGIEIGVARTCRVSG